MDVFQRWLREWIYVVLWPQVAAKIASNTPRCLMRPIQWILAGASVGVAITLLLFYEAPMQNEPGEDDVENVANQARAWGTKKRFGGGADLMAGRLKEGIGRVTGDNDLVGEGMLESVGTICRAGCLRQCFGGCLGRRRRPRPRSVWTELPKTGRPKEQIRSTKYVPAELEY